MKGSDVVKQMPDFPKWEPPVPDDVQFMPPKTIKDHPDYNETPVYEFSHVTKLLEGTGALFSMFLNYQSASERLVKITTMNRLGANLKNMAP